MIPSVLWAIPWSMRYGVIVVIIDIVISIITIIIIFIIIYIYNHHYCSFHIITIPVPYAYKKVNCGNYNIYLSGTSHNKMF